MKLGVLFSGGKDSAYACWQAMQSEEVTCLISIEPENVESYMFHTPNISLTGLQAEAAELPLVQGSTAGVEEEELGDLRAVIHRAQQEYGIEGIVTGAILSVYQASRIQRVCFDLGLWCFNPLWHCNQYDYMQRLIREGFEIIIAGVFAAPFDESWLGRTITPALLDEICRIEIKWQLSLTGEGGELETFVCDAPFFTRRIRITDNETTYRNHNGRYCITGAVLEEK